MTLNLTHYRVGELWKSFMPYKNSIVNACNNDLISLAVYPPSYFEKFSPATNFERWAAVEVSDFDNVPDNMETFILPEGLYAVFHYKGSADSSSIFQYIFGTWLPASEYMLDHRPHFEVLGEKYKNNDPDSEEEIWIPVKHKV